MKNLKKIACSPSSNNKYTCYNNESLLKMKTLWNMRHPDRKIYQQTQKIYGRIKKQYA